MSLKTLQTFASQINYHLYVPLSAALLIEILSSLQPIQLIFSSMEKFSPSSHFIILSLNKNLCFLTGAFSLQETSIYQSIYHSIWIFCGIYFAVHLLFLLFILRTSHQGNGGQRLIKILTWLYLLHSRILFFPIQFFLLNLCHLYNSSKDLSNIKFYQHTGWLLGSVILLVVNTSLALFKEFILYQINQTEDYYAVKTNIYHQIVVIYKIIALLFSFWNLNEASSVAKGSTVLHLMMGIFLIFVLYMKLPFYKFRMLKLTIILSTMIVCLSMISVIYVFVEDMEVVGGMHVLILLMPILGIKLILSQFRGLFKRILQGEFLFVDHAIHFGLLLENFIMKEKSFGSAKDNLFFPNREDYYGVLAIGEDKIPLEKFSDRKLINECELPIYLHIIEKLSSMTSDSKLLVLYIAQINLTKAGNIPKTLEILRKLEIASSNSSDLPLKASIEYLNNLLGKVYNEDSMGSEARLGLSHYFKYYDLASSIKTLMLTETKKQIEFWEDLRKRDLDAKKVYDRVEEIDEIFMRIRKECDSNLNNFRKNFTSPMLLYSVYLNNVRQMHSEGIQVLKSFQSIMFAQNANNELEAASGNTAVVIVSLDKARAGTILNASGSIHNIFNLKKTELIGKKFGYLFPTSIAKKYQQNIQEYAKAPEYKLDHKENTYGKTSNDEIFELEANFQLYPYINKELTLMVMLKKLSDPASLLIVNQEGIIVDCSKNMELMFQKESLNVKAFRSIQNLNSGFEKVNFAFNIVYSQNPQSVQSTVVKETTKFFNFENTGGDYEESSRNTGRSLLHGLASTPDRAKQRTPTEMSFEKAEFLCEEYLEGKQVVLNPSLASLFQKKGRFRAHVSIKPLRADEEIYKVVTINNLKKYTTSYFECSENNTCDEDENGIQTFGDTFPPDDERVMPKKVYPLKPLKTNMESSFTVEGEMKSDSEDHLHKAQQKLDNINQKGDHDDQRSSIKNSHHVESRTVRTLRDIGSRKKLQRSLGSLQILLYVMIAIILGLAFVKYELSTSSIDTIEKGVNIINLSTMRLQNAINTWLWSLVYITGVTSAEAMGNLTISMSKFTEYSIRLEHGLGQVKSEDGLSRAFQKDVKFWQLSVQGDVNNYMMVDTFTATNILMAKYLAIQEAQSLVQIYKMPDLALIFNNTSNDYLLSSKVLIYAADVILGEVISKDIFRLKVVLLIEIVALVAYVAIFIIMMYIISKSYQRLCRALMRTQEAEITQRIAQLNKVKTLFEDDIERRGFIQDSFDLFIEETSLNKVRKTKHHQGSNLRMSSMNKYLIRIALICLLFIPVFTGLFVDALFRTIHTFSFLEGVNDELSMLSDASVQSNLMMSTLVYSSVFGANPKMLIMNKTPREQIAENFMNFDGINQKLIETFLTTSNGREIDPFLVEILKTNVCGHLSDRSKGLCEYATNDQRMGLLSMSTGYYNSLRSMLASATPGISLGEVLVKFAGVLNQMTGQMTAMIEIYPIMMAHIIEGFEETVQDSKNDEIKYILVICVTVVIYVVFISLKPLKDFQKVDVGKRKILKIIPVSVIQENKALKFYLMQDFKTEVEGIKNKF